MQSCLNKIAPGDIIHSIRGCIWKVVSVPPSNTFHYCRAQLILGIPNYHIRVYEETNVSLHIIAKIIKAPK